MKTILSAILVLTVFQHAIAADGELRQQAEAALRKGVEFFRGELAVEGSYLWQYSEDLSQREGEGEATESQGWVQPPGTPSVGMAFLKAWEATGDSYYLEAARETAHALIQGQLNSGGWTYSIDFSPEGRRQRAYRVNGDPDDFNVSTLDDDTTQSALRFLMCTDQALGFNDASIRECIEYALNAVLEAQYPNGAWPQGFREPPDPDRYPVKPASYPEDWSRTWPGSRQYWFRYTLNDNVIANTVDTMFEAEGIYQGTKAGETFNRLAERCRDAAVKAGEFLILAQMPDSQAGWAQQYDFDMHPSWARKFEPPAISGYESRGAMEVLMRVYRETGERRFLEPIPKALEYYRSSRLDDGQLARFYELQTNKPLYFTRDYDLTYGDENMPAHYGFKVGDWTGSIQRQYDRLKKLSPQELKSKDGEETKPKVTTALIEEVQSIIADQDDQGRWIEPGPMRYHRPKDPEVRVINSSTFINNTEILSRYLKAIRL